MKDQREQMVYELKKKYGLSSVDVLSVMLQIPREKFVPKEQRHLAYKDAPVSIGFGQTMSQPYTVAFMTDLLDLGKNDKVLEVGTGSGYQAALLSKLAKEVYTIEIIPELAERAKRTLKKLDYKNVQVRSESGEYGWPEAAPFDAVIITAGLGEKVPEELFDQLKPDGVLVAPLGRTHNKTMTRFKKNKTGIIIREKFGIFHFVPFIEEKN
jgi:protein-L-isoaspartate(D-aspartate) O-methyltransferase